MFYENFLKLCIGKNISPSRVAQEMGFSKTAVTNWKNGGIPRDTGLRKIADYFGVTVDDLLGKEDEKKPAEEEHKMPPISKAVIRTRATLENRASQ